VAKARNLLWRADVRLLTLTGPPGIGKSRLSLTVAASVRAEFEHGVWFVPLAPINDPTLVASTIAQTLGLKEAGGQGIEGVLRAYLSDKQILLVLDNFEQILDAAPLVSDLLAAAPRVKALVSSRSPLHVYGEQEFPVPPLDLPPIAARGNGKQHPYLDAEPELYRALEESSAVTLFAQRAQAVQPDFALTPENTWAVAEICVRLDGLPLAIELAAARTKLFSPQMILEKLAGKEQSASTLELLAGGPRDRTDRQRTLRGAIDWSYNLLDSQEQLLFRRLSAFVGGRTLQAIREVCVVGEDEGRRTKDEDVFGPSSFVLRPLQIDVMDGVSSLVEKSLLGARDGSQQQTGAEGEPRFWMLETIHSYAKEKLEESGEANAVRLRHALYYLRLVEEAEPHLRGPEQKQWLDRLDGEHDNIRTALSWALQHGEGELAQRIAGPVWRFWSNRGYLTEGRAWLARAREAHPGHTHARALVCRAGGSLAQVQSDYAEARRLSEEAILIFRELGDRLNEARTLNNMGIATYEQGKLEESQHHFEQALQIQRNLADDWGVAAALTNLGLILMDMDEPAIARGYHAEALAIFRTLGDKRSATIALNNLAVLAHQEGSYQHAHAMWHECLSLYREMGNKENLGLTLANLGVLARDMGKYEDSRELYSEALTLLSEVGNLRVVGHSLDRLAGLAALKGQHEKAACLFGAADTLLQSVNAKLPTYNRQEHERFEALTRQSLGDERFASLWREGSRTSAEEAIKYALAP
jgi:predicted ATPase/Tfp pilus assembly protein PilF